MKKHSVTNWRSYHTFLKTNRKYRIFWFAGVISQLGNWFNYIAIFVLLTKLTGSGQAVSWFLIAKFIPTTLFGPAAGVIADRFSRKRIMICCDLARIGIVLGFLTINDPSYVWIVYSLALIQETLWTFADPARQASVPNLVTEEQLPMANALSGATWSVLLAFGAALGGLITALYGWQTAIVIDSLTFLASALFLSTIHLPGSSTKPPPPRTLREYTGIADIQAGYRYVRSHKTVGALMLIKSGWALSGGILVMLTVFGEQIFPIGGMGGGSGLMYSFRGIGAAIGPLIAWHILGESRQAMQRGIAISFYISAVSYLLFSQAPSLWIALPLVLTGHIGGSIQWVFSTTLLQQTVPDFVRGRVFAAEMAMLTLMLSISTFFTGFALDNSIAPRQIVIILACLFLIPGILWSRYYHKNKMVFSP